MAGREDVSEDVSVSVGVGVGVWGARKAESVPRGHSREPPTQAATRRSLTLPLRPTLVDLGWAGGRSPMCARRPWW